MASLEVFSRLLYIDLRQMDEAEDHVRATFRRIGCDCLLRGFFRFASPTKRQLQFGDAGESQRAGRREFRCALSAGECRFEFEVGLLRV